MKNNNTISIIWNVTARCPWNCKFCVMSAGNHRSCPIDLPQKLQVARNIDEADVKIDLSGGEIFNDREKDENMKLIEFLSKKHGKERIGISCSGYNIDNETASFLRENVHEVEMTMDAAPGIKYEYRYCFPNFKSNYQSVAGKAAELLKKHGIYTGLQTVLTREHLERPEMLAGLRHWIAKRNIDEWSLIRYFAAGRGKRFANLVMTDSENEELVRFAKELCKKEGSPKLDIHYLLPGTDKPKGCRCVKKSIGILPDGTVTACFWGLDGKGRAVPEYYLGNLLEQPLSEILNGENAVKWKNYHGGCKFCSAADSLNNEEIIK